MLNLGNGIFFLTEKVKVLQFLSRCPFPCFALQWGRVDATNCSDEPSLPSPTMTGDAMFDYFQSGFGFSRAQVSISSTFISTNILYERCFGSFYYIYVTRKSCWKDGRTRKFYIKMFTKLTSGFLWVLSQRPFK